MGWPPRKFHPEEFKAESVEARPAVVPGARSPAGTMFAALYGELTPHPWRKSGSDQDAYALFHDRSQAMGWLHDIGTATRKTATGVETRQVGAAGLWAMNDAGHEHPFAAATEVPLVAWFQVTLEPFSGERPMPVQPFLRCAGDTAARLGTFGLQAAQVLLPIHALDISSYPEAPLMPSLLTLEWFVDSDPQSTTAVRVTLDSGQVPSLPSVVSEIQEQINRLEQQVFVCESHSLTNDALTMPPPFADEFWNGPPMHRATFRGTLAEWSLDAIGWLGGFLADLSARHGVDTPVLLTVSRDD